MKFQFGCLLPLWINHFLVNAEQKRNVIVNGITAERNRYTYIASLQYKRNHICGATLIAPDVILTAAHCVAQPDLINHLKVVVGEYHLQDHMDSGETFYISSMDIHPQFVVTNSYVDNDVAVIKISGYSTNEPVMLNRKHKVPRKDNRLTVMGWGSVDVKGEYLSNVVQEVDLNYLFNWECLKKGILAVTDNMLCAFDQDLDNVKEDSCYGDSGGPLIIKKSNGPDLQVGIVSYGSEICAEYPGIYTRISRVHDWIRQRTCKISDYPPDYFDCVNLNQGNDFKTISTSTPSISPTDASSSSLPTRVQSVSETEIKKNDLIAATFIIPQNEESSTSDTQTPSHLRRNAILSLLSAFLFIIL